MTSTRSIPAYDRSRLLTFMAEHGIDQTTVDHSPILRVEDGLRLSANLPGLITKCLFLNDRKGGLWLVAAAHDTVIDLKQLRRPLGADRLSFANEALLWGTLGVRPGSVTALGLINDRDRQVTIVLDRHLWEAHLVNFHPLENTATTRLTQQGFRRFLQVLGLTPLVFDLDATCTM